LRQSLLADDSAFSQVLSGNLVAGSGVRVVTVNWKRQAPLEHWQRPGRARCRPLSRPARAIERL
jgi:hypothetical protein